MANEPVLLSTILEALHHGSSSSTTTPFLETDDPEEVVISVGENDFSHPCDEVMQHPKDGVSPRRGAAVVAGGGEVGDSPLWHSADKRALTGGCEHSLAACLGELVVFRKTDLAFCLATIACRRGRLAQHSARCDAFDHRLSVDLGFVHLQ
jgi:hypothetical protein